jgi:ribosomal protein S18 acetylase RimI-like enzyme
MTDADLYRRGIETLLASWAAYARGSPGAAVMRFPGVSAAVFPDEPERHIYNNAVFDRDLAPAERAEAMAAIDDAYAAADVDRFAVWVHENDEATRVDLRQRGYVLAEWTRAMGMVLEDILVPRPDIDLRPSNWDEHRRTLGLPPGLLDGIDHSDFHLLVAPLDGKNVASAMAFDHEGDCGIYNTGTLERARRRGLATGLTARHLHDALARGCRTASVQSTTIAERVYAGVGFRDLGRILEYVPWSGNRR